MSRLAERNGRVCGLCGRPEGDGAGALQLDYVVRPESPGDGEFQLAHTQCVTPRS
jgi:hypothetical protein